jgi:predicted nucleic acid-binding protein
VPLLLDTGILYAYYDRKDAWHDAARDLIEQESGPLLLPSPVIPEVDHLLKSRLGSKAQNVFYQSLVERDFLVVNLPQEGYRRVLELNQKYGDLGLGFVDASVLTIAEQLRMGRIGTTDRRHFAIVAVDIPLELLPASI